MVEREWRRRRLLSSPSPPLWKQLATLPPAGQCTNMFLTTSTSSLLLVLASLISGFTLKPTLPSGPRGLTSAQLASSGSVAAPLPHLTATKQYRGATVRAHTEQVELNCKKLFPKSLAVVILSFVRDWMHGRENLDHKVNFGHFSLN